MVVADRERNELRWWERMVLVLFGSFLVGADAGSHWVRVIVAVAGWAVILSAVGVVELAMALYYRARRQLRSRSHVG